MTNPPALDHAIRRCLAKEPADRWQSARDLAVELKWSGESVTQTAVPAQAMERSQSTLTWERLVERDGKHYAYRLTSKGNKTALLFVLFHKCVCGPLANSLFNPPPTTQFPATRLEAAYRKADQSIEQLLQLLAA